MKKVIVGLFVLALVVLSQPVQADPPDTTGAEKLGWKLTLQSWTVQGTVFGALDICKELGIKYIETYPSQPISLEDKTKFGPGTSDEQIKAVLDKAKACGVQLIDCG